MSVSPTNSQTVGSAFVVTAYVKDAYGHNITGHNVTFTTTFGTLSASSCLSANDGSCQVTLESLTAGTATIHGFVNGNQNMNGSPAGATFTDSTIDVNKSRVDIATGTRVANGTDSFRANVTAVNSGNLPVANTTVNFFVSGGDIARSCTTNASGQCEVFWTSTKNGTYELNATVGGANINGSQTQRTFVSGPANAANSTLVIPQAGPKYIGGVDNYSVIITARDIFGNLANATTVNVNISGGYLLPAPNCVTDASGECTLHWYSNATGTFDIAGYIAGDRVASNDTNRSFRSNPANAANSELIVTPSNGTLVADDVQAYQANVIIRDAANRTVVGESVTIGIPSRPSDLSLNGASQDSVTCTTDINGACPLNVTIKSKIAGRYMLTAKVANGDQVSGSPHQIEFVAGEPHRSNTFLYVSPQDGVIADGVDHYNATVVVADFFANVIANKTVTFGITGGNLSNGTCMTNAAGTCLVEWSSTVDGTFTINATVLTSNGTIVEAQNATDKRFYFGNISTAMISATPNSTDTGNLSLITVTLLDSTGNAINDKDVYIFIASGANTTLGGTSARNVTAHNNRDGTYTTNVTSDVYGAVTLGFGVVGLGDQVNTTTVMFDSRFFAGYSTIEANPTLLDVGNTSTITVTLRDSNNRTITSYDQYGVNIYIAELNGTNRVAITRGTTIRNATTGGNTQQVVAINNHDGTYTAYLDSTMGRNVDVWFSAYLLAGAPSAAEIDNVGVGFRAATTQLLVSLNASKAEARIGDMVMYSARVENIGSSTASGFTLSGLIPKFFGYIDGSARVVNASGATINYNGSLFANNLTLDAGEVVYIYYMTRVSAGAKKGTYTSYAEAFQDETISTSLSNRASAKVEISTDDPLFDDSLIFGTVFNDANGNGNRDEGERGLPGVRIMTVEGYIITTDSFGRYHLLDINGGDWGIGRNFIMKVDASSLPKGAKFTTPNPLLRRVTPGLPVRFDFGVSIGGTAPNRVAAQSNQGGQK
jgi:uncharacterized repeat protein (TIGR01451 family)